MMETEPTQPLPKLPGSYLQADEETEPSISADIYAHVQLLYDGYLSKAIRKVLESPITVEVEPNMYIHYPSPAEAWKQDSTFRHWGCRLANTLQRQSIANNTRFNILFFINAIRNYDENYQSFTAWYEREKTNTTTSWLKQAIQEEQFNGQRYTKPLST